MIEQIAKFFRGVRTAYRWQRYWDLMGINPAALRKEAVMTIEEQLKEGLKQFINQPLNVDTQQMIEAEATKIIQAYEDRLMLGNLRVTAHPAVQAVKVKPVRLRVVDGRLIRNTQEIVDKLALDDIHVDIKMDVPRPAERLDIRFPDTPENRQMAEAMQQAIDQEMANENKEEE